MHRPRPPAAPASTARHMAGGRRRRRRPSDGPDGDPRPGDTRCGGGRRAPRAPRGRGGLGHTGADAREIAEALQSLRRPLVTHLFNGMEPLHDCRRGRSPPPGCAGARGNPWSYRGRRIADETVHLVFAWTPGGTSYSSATRWWPPECRTATSSSVRDRCGSRTAGPGRVPSRRPSREAPRTPPTWYAAASFRPVSIPSPRWRRGTSTPAALLGLDDRGSLATGLRADLVVLDRDGGTAG